MSEKENKILRIKKAVCHVLDVPITHLKMKTRRKEIVKARRLSYYMISLLNDYSLEYMALSVSNQSHSNAIHGINKIKRLIEISDENTLNQINEINQILNN